MVLTVRCCIGCHALMAMAVLLHAVVGMHWRTDLGPQQGRRREQGREHDQIAQPLSDFALSHLHIEDYSQDGT